MTARPATAQEFQEVIRRHGTHLYRDMPWRRDTRPYYVLVSELMLQQTQVARVIPKFEQFIRTFPDIPALAKAPLAEVLKLWQGLGYNRRAKFLHQAARLAVDEYDGEIPSDELNLLRLPGVGKNTAGAIRAYAYNQPSIFIETNIRTVYTYHFFVDDSKVADQEIISKLEATLDRKHPREFYWALMDYGAHLKSEGVKTNHRSVGYKKQSRLEGSLRQMRGRIIAALTAGGDLTDQALRVAVQADARYEQALVGLEKDGLVVVMQDSIHLAE